MPKVEIGDRIEPIVLTTLSHGEVALPDGGLVHLQFRRWAGCPICNLHVRRYTAQLDAVRASGVRPLVFFHSSAQAMSSYQAALPFPIVPDLERRWYHRFGVERSASSIMHPRALGRAMWGLARGVANPLRGEGGYVGLPADVLLDGAGVVRAIRYGTHAADQWSPDEVIALATELQPHVDTIGSDAPGTHRR